MSKVAVIFWSGTGNTETMANCVCEGAKSKGADVTLFEANKFSKDLVDNFDAFAFGCPSMGSEVLEDGDFEPMWDNVKGSLKDIKVVLFGSYDWGDGEWMRNWTEECNSLGITLAKDFVIANLEPDEPSKTACKSLGEAIAS
ncbi:MAG: flavodoxin [Lachnospirales bacterium]